MYMLSSFLLLIIVIETSGVVQCDEEKKKYEYAVRTNRKQFIGPHDLITFPNDDILVNDDGAVHHTETDTNNINKIPFDLLIKINEMSNVTEFLDKFVDRDTINPQDGIFARLQNENNMERGNTLNPKPASCMPVPTVVSLLPDGANDPSLVYFPSCTRVNRCSGCSSDKLLKCQPIEVETKNFQISVSQYVGGSTLSYKGKVPVFVDVHTKCKYDCAITANDCTKYQRYNKPLCQCECTNLTDLKKCLATPDGLRIWDTENCVCKCRYEKDCTTGTEWDANTCSCVESLAIPKRNISLKDRSRFILKPIPVGQTDDTKYKIAQ